MTAAIAALLALLGALVSPLPAPASTEPQMEFSQDGQHWSPEMPPLFPTTLLVPGERATAVVWARHHGPGPARSTVTLGDHLRDPAGAPLREWLVVHLNGQPAGPGAIWQGPVVDPGTPLELQVDVALPPDAPAATRAQTDQVLSRLTFSEVAPSHHQPDDGVLSPALPPGSKAADRADSPGPGDLGNPDRDRLTTSGVSAVALLALTAVLVATGVTIRARHRRRSVNSPAAG